MAADIREKEQLEYLFLDLEWNQALGTTGLDGREKQIGKTTGNGRDGIENEKYGGKRLWL